MLSGERSLSYAGQRPARSKYWWRLVFGLVAVDLIVAAIPDGHDPSKACASHGCDAHLALKPVASKPKPVNLPDQTTPTTAVEAQVSARPTPPPQQPPAVSVRLQPTTTSTSTTLTPVAKTQPAVRQHSIRVNNGIYYDISWPQCGHPLPSAAGGIVGLDHGLNFTLNPCLAQEAGQFDVLSGYILSDLPDHQTVVNDLVLHTGSVAPPVPNCPPDLESCLDYRFGYEAAKFALDNASKFNLHFQAVVVDVETGNPWSNNAVLNSYEIQGQVDYLKRTIGIVGLYSNQAQWSQITGGQFHEPGLPEWVPVSSGNSAQAAAGYCQNHSFNHGRTDLVQYQDPVPPGVKAPYDDDILC